MEVWKSIAGFGGIFQVSNYGNIKRKEKYLKKTVTANGYEMVNLRINKIRTAKYVHRLVAEAFIPNPSGFPQVNHKDEVKANNHVDNLEWCTHRYNQTYGTKINRWRAKKNMPVRNCMTGEVYESILAAKKATGINHIGLCCRGKSDYAGKIIIDGNPVFIKWEFVQDFNINILE